MIENAIKVKLPACSARVTQDRVVENLCQQAGSLVLPWLSAHTMLWASSRRACLTLFLRIVRTYIKASCSSRRHCLSQSSLELRGRGKKI